MSFASQETYLLRRWLRSHGKLAQLWPSTHWLNLMTPMLPVQFATGTTLQHLRLLLWMWHVSSFPLSFWFLPKRKLISITRVKVMLWFCFSDVKEIEVSGTLIIREGETLNLTCRLDSFPPSVLTWTKYSETTESFLQINSRDFYGSDNNSRSFQQEQRHGMASFFLSNVTVEDSGQYICTAKHLNTTLMEKIDIKVICK